MILPPFSIRRYMYPNIRKTLKKSSLCGSTPQGVTPEG
jgi:hypothetical protein